MHRINFYLLFLMALALFNCRDEPDCTSITTNFANLRFYKLENNEVDTVTINSLKPLTSDSVLVSDADISEIIRIPLNPNSTSTTLAFDTEFGLDTLILSYAVNTRLVSEDCGLEVFFSQLDTLRNDFDSIRIVNQIPIEDINEDIRIYN